MDRLVSRPNSRRVSGFTLIETMVAITILSVGLLSMASLIAKATATSNNSRYTSTQSLLASEKLDELSALSSSDAQIAVTGTAGSLTADSSSGGIDYFDNVLISNGANGIAETSTSTNGAGATVYTTTTHSPNGAVTTTSATTAPVTTADTILYDRRWVIEQDQPVVGVRRITVLVNVQSTTPSAGFEMSIVRQ